MNSYTVQSGSAIAVSRNGGPFVDYVTTKNQHFWQFAEQTDDSFTFANKAWRLCVPKAMVKTWEHESLT